MYLSLTEEQQMIRDTARQFAESELAPRAARMDQAAEMDPEQLRETTMNRDTRRLVQLTISGKDKTDQLMDMLLAKKRSKDRRTWLESKGNLAEV